MKNIILVEDDQQITKLLHLHLSSNYAITACTTGEEALQKMETDSYHLMILDIMLPGLSGLEVCKQLRKEHNIPILMLTSRADESDKVLALELGADDYITKPFGILELIARTKAILRRGEYKDEENQEKKFIHHKDLIIDKNKRKATLKGELLELTQKEFDLLFLLAGNPGKPFSRKEILELVWGFSFNGYEHTVTAHINRLRIKIEEDLNQPKYILTSWGIGYRFSE